MRALQYQSYGGPEVLQVGAAPDPHPGPGQVRVRVRASSLNPIDWKLRSGMRAGGKALEGVGSVGFDAAGVVDELGDGVTDVAVGDDVFGLGSGTAAELAVLHAYARKPASVDWSVAAGAGVAGETAIRALDLVGVGSGSTVLIDGGAGGVGAVAVQIAVARGATVVATASEDNLGYLGEIGATAITYGEGMAERARAAAPGGFDAVFDVAGKTAPDILASLVPEPAKAITIAQYDVGDSGMQSTFGGEGDPRAAMEEAARLLEQNALVIKVQTFPLDRAAEAFRISEGGHVRGKLVLLP
ncbi:NADP-dependent oxidoreductase [uncultured Friedmanniella sp.]|uniref:NADP-dependent oxidoreductase n=1 Tax=uncultured Friedmanniella sp. TaxID=335381 RepID=UPI0035CA4FB1